MKVVIITPSGKRVEFGPDEEVRFTCTENGTHKMMLCGDDDHTWYWELRCGDDDHTWYWELHHTQHTQIVNALPANKWKVELS